MKKGGTISKRKYRNRGWLYEKYVKEGRNQTEISRLCDCNKTTIGNWLEKFGIEKRALSEIQRKINLNEEWVIKQYKEEGRTALDIAEEVGYETDQPILRALKRNGIKIRDAGYYKKINLDYEWLKKEYIDEERSTVDIAKELGCDPSVIRKRLKEVGVKIRGSSNHFDITSGLIKLLDGTLLGDGCIYQKSEPSAIYNIIQNNRPYIIWMKKKINNYGIKGRINKRTDTSKQIAKNFGRKEPENNKEFTYYTFDTLNYVEMKKQYRRWYPNGEKIIPRDITIKPLSMFIWYVEDGSYYAENNSVTIRFHTQGFKREEVEYIRKKINNKLDININLIITSKKYGKNPILQLTKFSDVDKLFSFMANIPEELKPYYGYKFPNLKEPALKLRR